MTLVLLGQVSQYVLQRLQTQRPLDGASVVITPQLGQLLPDFAHCIGLLGASVDTVVADGDIDWLDIHLAGTHAAVVADWTASDPSNGDSDRPGVRFPIGALSSVIYVVRRRLCDYAVWERLLCRQTNTALAGKALILDRYCDIGRVIAHRARSLGMLVYIENAQSERPSGAILESTLDALYDGFSLLPANSAPISGSIRISVAELITALGAAPSSSDTEVVALESMLAGIVDEVTAACVVATALLGKQMTSRGSADFVRWSTTADPLIYDALISARSPAANRESDGPWQTNLW